MGPICLGQDRWLYLMLNCMLYLCHPVVTQFDFIRILVIDGIQWLLLNKTMFLSKYWYIQKELSAPFARGSNVRNQPPATPYYKRKILRNSFSKLGGQH